MSAQGINSFLLADGVRARPATTVGATSAPKKPWIFNNDCFFYHKPDIHLCSGSVECFADVSEFQATIWSEVEMVREKILVCHYKRQLQ